MRYFTCDGSAPISWKMDIGPGCDRVNCTARENCRHFLMFFTNETCISWPSFIKYVLIHKSILYTDMKCSDLIRDHCCHLWWDVSLIRSTAMVKCSRWLDAETCPTLKYCLVYTFISLQYISNQPWSQLPASQKKKNNPQLHWLQEN